MIRDEVYLRHILDAIEVIRGYADVGEEVFMREGMRQDAIVRQLAVIGEAVKFLSDESRSTVWRTVEQDIPTLQAAVHRLLDTD